MLVKLEINEVDVAQLTEGTPAKVRVDALPGEVFDGTVTKVARQALRPVRRRRVRPR